MPSLFNVEVNMKGGIIDCYDSQDKKFKKIAFDHANGLDFGNLQVITAEIISFAGELELRLPGVSARSGCCWTWKGWVKGWSDRQSVITSDYIKVFCKDTGQIDKIEYYEPGCPMREIRYEPRPPEAMHEAHFLQIGGFYHLFVLEDPQDGTRHTVIVGMDPEYPGQYWVWHDDCLP